jgi:hypothetical protein
MKKLWLFTILLTHLICLQTNAVDDIPAGLVNPKMVQGYPSIMTSPFISKFNDTKITITLPNGWGIGAMSHENETAEFILYPSGHWLDYGCQIFVSRFEDESAAIAAFERLKKVYAERYAPMFVILTNGAFSVRRTGVFIIHTWYMVDRHTQEREQAWNQLKYCLKAEVESDNLN